MDNLYKDHMAEKLRQASQLLEKFSYDSLIIDSGSPAYFFHDDQMMPFKPNPFFSLFCPDTGTNHLLQIEKGKKPTLAFFSPNDFWHDTAQLSSPFWADEFEIVVCSETEETWRKLNTSKGKHCVLTPTPESAVEKGYELVGDKMLLGLAWIRTSKTPYEIACIKEANRIASCGHAAARVSFLAGDSEVEINGKYLLAAGLLEHQLPYRSIIGLNEKAAILHYHGARGQRDGQSLLIDAGATFRNYCADITRTHFRESIPGVFKDLYAGIEKIQQNLCVQVVPGIYYPELNNQANRAIGQLLVDLGIVTGVSLEEAIELEIVSAFFPHGLGHPLGLQVHDVAGKQVDDHGTPGEMDPRYPHLRTLRTICENDVLTIEPGCYFIHLLLDPIRADRKLRNTIDWKLVDQLWSCGGIRVEDNVVARPHGPENLTRYFLPN